MIIYSNYLLNNTLQTHNILNCLLFIKLKIQNLIVDLLCIKYTENNPQLHFSLYT